MHGFQPIKRNAEYKLLASCYLCSLSKWLSLTCVPKEMNMTMGKSLEPSEVPLIWLPIGVETGRILMGLALCDIIRDKVPATGDYRHRQATRQRDRDPNREYPSG